jgi:type I restriction enzyme M protein
LVPHDQLALNDYNLSVSSYVVKEDTREVVDIAELKKEIERIVARQMELRSQIDAIVKDLEGSR